MKKKRKAEGSDNMKAVAGGASIESITGNSFHVI
jgi:hypothetical protein